MKVLFRGTFHASRLIFEEGLCDDSNLYLFIYRNSNRIGLYCEDSENYVNVYYRKESAKSILTILKGNALNPVAIAQFEKVLVDIGWL